MCAIDSTPSEPRQTTTSGICGIKAHDRRWRRKVPTRHSSRVRPVAHRLTGLYRIGHRPYLSFSILGHTIHPWHCPCPAEDSHRLKKPSPGWSSSRKSVAANGCFGCHSATHRDRLRYRSGPYASLVLCRLQPKCPGATSSATLSPLLRDRAPGWLFLLERVRIDRAAVIGRVMELR